MNRVIFHLDIFSCLLIILVMIIAFGIDFTWYKKLGLLALLVGYGFSNYALIRFLVAPWFFRGGRHRVMSIAIGATLALLTLLIVIFDGRLIHSKMEGTNYPPDIEKTIDLAISLFFLIVGSLAFVVGLLSRQAHLRIKLLKTQYERDQALLTHYRAQLPTHFLYNSLNTLYSLIIAGDKRSEQVLSQIVNLTRISSRMLHLEQITVGEEVEHIRDYLELQRLRIEKPEKLVFEYEHTREVKISPLLLSPFVGNAVKYGLASGSEEDIIINIKLDDNGLHLHTLNPMSLNKNDEGQSDKDSGTGIENCKKRLDLFYPDRHSLQVGERDGKFEVDLWIDV